MRKVAVLYYADFRSSSVWYDSIGSNLLIRGSNIHSGSDDLRVSESQGGGA